MKFLLVHSFYGSASPSGENKVVLSLSKLLKKNNHLVTECFFYSDHLPKNRLLAMFVAGFSYIFNPLSLLKIQIKILLHKPDIIHIHNTFPLVSPFVFYLYTGRAKVVQTLHNYRYFCASAILKQPNSMQPCMRCIDEDSIFPALYNKCYRESRLATLPIALSIYIHKLLHTYQAKVDHFIVLSEFAKSIFHRAGIDYNIMSVASNPIELELLEDKTISPELDPYPNKIDLLYVGRLSSEKGVLNFLTQLRNASLLDCYSITIVGEGPEGPAIKSLFHNTHHRLLPRCSAEEVLGLMKRSKALVIPSVCVEGMPSVLIEAFSVGTPILASEIGPLPNLIQEANAGFTFNPFDSDSIRYALDNFFHTESSYNLMSTNATSYYNRFFSTQSSMTRYLQIVSSLIGHE